MNQNLTNQQPLTAKKRNIASWTLGTIGIILSIFGGIFFIFLMPDNLYYAIPSKSWFDVVFFYYLVILIVVIWGLIKGIKELKLAKKKLSVIGVILSSVGLILVIVIGLLLELYIFVSTT